IDLIEEGADLAIRVGPLADTAGLKMRRYGEMRMLVCAAPAYLAAHGVPQTAAELAAHDAIVYGRMGRAVQWQFVDEAGAALVAHPKARLALDDLEAMAAAVRAGLGITRLPHWLVSEALARGELVALLPGLHTVGFPVHAVWPYTRQYSARLRVVLDALAEALPPLLA
ncbi:MAG TPA: LysR substrate-binding domain-containing protein, partial [Chitinolyticbacter sp.]|nr:LysR substrate-binding domain-containing protein [Chitinolyticbacter sp.]